MELTREQVNVGIAAGLALTNPDDDRLYVPMKHAAGSLVLRQLLMLLAGGQLGLTSTMQQEAPPGDGEDLPPPTPPKPPKDSQGPALKKGAKKKVAKKKITKKKK